MKGVGRVDGLSKIQHCICIEYWKEELLLAKALERLLLESRVCLCTQLHTS